MNTFVVYFTLFFNKIIDCILNICGILHLGRFNNRLRMLLFHNHRVCLKFLLNDLYKSISFHPKYEEKTNDVYVCWFQGMDDAPPLVRLCYSSLLKNNPDKKIHLITNDNLDDYTDGIPNIIMDKYHSGVLSKQVFTDILRSYLLSERGGFWVDATLLVLGELPLKSPFYTIKKVKNKSIYVSKRRWTSYFLYSVPGGAVMTWWFKAMCLYFEITSTQIDYWLNDAIVALGYDLIPQVRQEIDAVEDNNVNVSFLIHKQNDEFNKQDFERVLVDTMLFKLDWRIKLQKRNCMTYYEYLSKLFM